MHGPRFRPLTTTVEKLLKLWSRKMCKQLFFEHTIATTLSKQSVWEKFSQTDCLLNVFKVDKSKQHYYSTDYNQLRTQALRKPGNETTPILIQLYNSLKPFIQLIIIKISLNSHIKHLKLSLTPCESLKKSFS